MAKLSETTECDIPDHISNMAKNLIKLSENNWMEQPKAPTASTIKNPYQNFNSDVNDDNTNYYSHYNSASFSGNMYVFHMIAFFEIMPNTYFGFLGTTLVVMKLTKKFVMILKTSFEPCPTEPISLCKWAKNKFNDDAKFIKYSF